MPAQLYKTWLKPLVYLGFDDTQQVLRLGAPNQFKLNWVRSQYGSRITDLAHEVFGPQTTVSFELIATEAPPSARPPARPGAALAAQAQAQHASPAAEAGANGEA